MFGESWDEPIYWDTLTPVQAHELLRGWPFSDLAASVVGSSDASTAVYESLGEIMSVSMASELGALPFAMEVSSASTPACLPHLDLTKLLWLLRTSVLVWADLAFFAGRTQLNVQASEESLDVSFGFGLRRHPLSADAAWPTAPRLLEIIERHAEDLPHHLEVKENHLSLRAYAESYREAGPELATM